MSFDVKFDEDDPMPGKKNAKITIGLPKDYEEKLREIPTEQLFKQTLKFWKHALDEWQKKKQAS